MLFWEYEILEIFIKKWGEPRVYLKKKWWEKEWGMLSIQTFEEGAISSVITLFRDNKKDLWTTHKSGLITHGLSVFNGDLVATLVERTS